jgi:peptidoglycan biosynthesis protein MviN/MurJ (putative lipid II flippase)
MPQAEAMIAEGGGKNFIRPSFFWILAFVFCCLQALMVQKLVLPLVPSLHAGHGLLVNDAIIFHDTAVNIAELIRTVGWSEWSLYPARFSANVGILSALYAVFGPEPAVFIPLNAAAHVTGALMLYLIGPLLWPGSVGRLGGLIAAILFVSFPSTLLWYSQNHKDAFTIAGSLTMLYAWLLLLGGKCVYRSALRPLFLAALGGGVVLSMRPYLSIMLATGFVLAWFCCFALSRQVKGEWRGNLASWAIASFLLLACLGGLFGIILPASEGALSVDIASSLSKVIEWKWKSSDSLPHWFEAPFRRISELRAHFIAHGLSVGAGSGIDQEFMPATIWQALVYFPRALFIGTLAPYPAMWLEHTSAPRLATACETFVWYLLGGGILVLLYRRPTFPLMAGLVFCLFLIMIYSYVSPNIGTLYRVRFGFWMFLLLCGTIGWCSLLLPFLDRITGERSARKCSNNNERSINGLAAAGSIALIITFVAFFGFFARDLLLISFRGIGGDLDAFFSAAMLPMVFVSCLSMPMADAMTKPFLSFYMKGEMAKSAAIVQQFLTIGIFAALAITLAIFFLAKEAVGLVLGTTDKQSIAQGALYLRVFAPIFFLSVWTVLGNSVLNGIHKSTQAALAQLIVPVCAVGAILAVRQDHTLFAAAVGMLLGTFLNASVLIILCARNGILMWPSRLRSCFSEVELQSYVWLVFAAIFTALIAPINFYFAGTVGQGSVTAWAFASKIVVLFSSLFAFGVTAVVLPHLAAKFEKADNTSGINHFFFLLIAGTWIGGLVVVALSIFAEPMVYALFASDGQVTEHQMAILIRILRIGALQVPVAIAGAIIFKSAAISCASGQAVLASFLGLATNIVGNFFLVPRLGLEGIAIGALVAIIVSTIFLCISTRKSYGTSLSVSAILLFGWSLWIGFAWAIDLKNNLALAGVVFGVFVLAAMHWFSWKHQLHKGFKSRR